MRFQRRGGRKRIVAADGREFVPSSKPQAQGALVKALACAWRWQKLLDARVYTSATEIAGVEGIGKSYVSRILRLTLLAPDIIEALLEGRAELGLILGRLERPLPAKWGEQLGLLPVGSATFTRLMERTEGGRPCQRIGTSSARSWRPARCGR